MKPEPQGASVLDHIEGWLGSATRGIALIGVVGMLAIAAITVFDVIARWLFDGGITALNEIVSMLFAVAIAACIPAGLAQGVNLRIDVAERWFSNRMAAQLGAFGSVMLLLLYGLLAWRLFDYAGLLASRHSTTVLRDWPQAPFFYVVAGLLAFGSLVQVVVTVNTARRAFLATHDVAQRNMSPSVLVVTWLISAATLALIAYAFHDFNGLSTWARAHPGASVAVGFVLMWSCLLWLVPLAAVMGLIGIAGTTLFVGAVPALSAFATEVAGFLANSQVATLPLFLMMGSFAAVAGISDDVYALAQALVGRFRGGLALATIGGCAGFGAVTGSSLATVATFGRVALPEMRARGYSAGLATGCVAAGGTLGALLPPSGPLVVFALLTESSVGQLFIAAIVPGLIATALYFLTIMLFVRASPGAAPEAEAISAGRIWAALRRCTAVIILFGAVLGGMYSGVFTSTEAAGVGAMGAFCVALVRQRLRRDRFFEVMGETTRSTAMIYGLIFGAVVFSFFVGATELPEIATRFIGSLQLPHITVVCMLLILYLVLGSIMDSFAVMIITVPIVTPLITSMGYDIVWWGIVMLAVVETGMITPPFGLNVFVLKSTLADVPMGVIFRGVLPFVAADLVKLVLLVAFPILAVWLPSTMLN